MPSKNRNRNRRKKQRRKDKAKKQLQKLPELPVVLLTLIMQYKIEMDVCEARMLDYERKAHKIWVQTYATLGYMKTSDLGMLIPAFVDDLLQALNALMEVSEYYFTTIRTERAIPDNTKKALHQMGNHINLLNENDEELAEICEKAVERLCTKDLPDSSLWIKHYGM